MASAIVPALVACLVSGVADADPLALSDTSAADLMRACAIDGDPVSLPGPACVTIADAGNPSVAAVQTGQPRREQSFVSPPSELNANSANPSGSPVPSASVLAIHRGL